MAMIGFRLEISDLRQEQKQQRAGNANNFSLISFELRHFLFEIYILSV